MDYGDFEDSSIRTTSDKLLCDKAFNIAKNPKYDGYQRGRPSAVTNFLIKYIQTVLLKVRWWKTKSQLKNYINQLLEKQLSKKICSPFKVNIWGADLAVDKKI